MPVLLMETLQQLGVNQDPMALADKIAQDTSMTVRILRIANSPFYGMSREIGSLREAIVLLGLNRIRDMLMGICFSKMLQVRHKNFNYNQFWHHSIAVAECSRQLSYCTGISPDFAYTAGLLHDIGRLVIVLLFPDEYSQIIKAFESPQAETERRLLGFDNVEIGGQAAQYWNLPVAIQEAIEQHETTPRPISGSNAVRSLGLLVYTANFLITQTERSDPLVIARDGVYAANLPGAGAAFDDHESIQPALAILNVSIDQAMHCANSGRQFADQVVTLF
ncbi:MAG: HDOD domain-containing protein [Methylobacter sp.]|nr:HDOD domain-containing protein [Candidatus Methylobacter titanis]